MYQVQIQEPKFKHRQALELANYIDISHAIASPITLFISKFDYEDKISNIIHMFSYSIGKERVVAWSAYLRDKNQVVFDGACKFNSYSFIEYQNNWKKRGFEPITTQVKNKFQKRIHRYLDRDSHPLIRTREDYKALLLYQSWYEDNLKDDEFTELFSQLNQEELRYKYERAQSIKYEIDNILISFFRVVYHREYEYERDEEISSYMMDIYEKVQANLLSYESSLNVNQMIGNYRQDKEATKIGEAFERAISRSKFTNEDVMDLLEECPRNDDECWGEYQDEKSPCAIYTYGDTSFHGSDNRHPSLDLR